MKKLKISRSKPAHGPFSGKRITMEEALETTYALVDYHEGLKRNSPPAEKPDQDLSYLLRCNRISIKYHLEINLSLTGISYKKNYLTEDQVIYTWLIAHKQCSETPLISIGNKIITLQKWQQKHQ